MGAGAPLSKQYVVCLNSNMLGMPYEPAGPAMSPDNTMRDNPNEPALHPLIRNWFGSQSPSTPHVNIDPYRRAMSLDYGYTYPLNGDGEYLINSYQYENAHQPVTHTPYIYSEGLSGPTFGSLGIDSYANFGLGGSSFDTLDLRFNETGWNQSLPSSTDYDYGDTPGSAVSPYYASLLDEENRDEWNEGIPYFDKYLMGSPLGALANAQGPIAPSAANPRMTSAGLVGTYSGLFANLLPASFLNAEPRVLFDHTFGYTNANTYNNEDPNLPDPLSPGVTVESTYNFYVDSSPNYEDVIAPANIPECILPNFYMLQSSILQHLDIAAAERPYAYRRQVSADTEDINFDILLWTLAVPPTQGTYPAISEGYWNLYSTTLSNLNPTALTEFEGKYKNIVVPLGSLDFISAQNEASSFSGDPANPGPSGPFTALATYPFYNKITLQPIGIPSDNDTNLGPERGATATPGNEDFLAGLLGPTLTSLTAAETTCFVRSLQLLIANSYNPNASPDPADDLTGLVAHQFLAGFDRRPALSMDLNFMGTGFNEESDQPQEIQHTLGKAQPIKVCAEVDKILDDGTDLRVLTRASQPYPYYYINLEKLTANEKDINYSILRDAINGNRYSDASTWENTVGGLDRHQIREAIKDYTRNLNSVFKGELSNVSPLMYLIEKRRIPDGELSVPLSVEPVQRIFITRDFGPFGPSPITYYDTQIKYGVRYQYDVRVINIVFGTQYEYTNLNTDFPYTEVENIPLASSGRALGNALGFYNEESADVTTMGNYLVGGPVDGDGCQHNHLRLSDETNLASPEDSSLMDPTMYFSDSGELGWPSTPYQTDIGEDPGWDSANGTAVSFKEGAATNKPVGQTGFYAFGGTEQSLPESHPVESLQGRPAFPPDWTGPFGTFYDQGGPMGVFDLQSTITDPYGQQFATPQPGGMYTPSAVNNMLRRMEVKVVGGLGHDGNSDGGLVPWSVATPTWTSPGEINQPNSPIGWCDWLKKYHVHLGLAFRDWYGDRSSFCSIGAAQSPTWFGCPPYEWAMSNVWHWERGGWDCSTVNSLQNNQNVERWFHGDSNCMLANLFPVWWDPGLANHMPSWPTYVTQFAGQDPDRNGEQGRQTAAWYCPNWTILHSGLDNNTWHPHSIYQIVYWLAKGADAEWQYASDHSKIDDPWSPTMKAYLYPKSDLGMNHGRQILIEFMNYWNQNYLNYGGSEPSRSHLGVYYPATGGTLEQAIAADHGNQWGSSAWLQMIDRLYLPLCLGDDAWPTPASFTAPSGPGSGWL